MSVNKWIQGARPKTLWLSVSSVIVGACSAYPVISGGLYCTKVRTDTSQCPAVEAQAQTMMSRFWLVVLLCLAVGVLLQAAANFANDYADGVRGADAGRGGKEKVTGKPQRLVAAGLATPRQVLTAAIVCAALACASGLAVVLITQAWWLLAVGAACLLAAWFYTGGRHPYGYAGFGELAVFLFFGLAAVLGTQYALCGTTSLFGALCAVVSGLLCCQLLMVNNLRDVRDDAAHGKKTLAVRMGPRAARVLLVVCCVVAYLIAAWLVMMLWLPWGGVLLLSGLGVTWRMISSVFAAAGRDDEESGKRFRTALSDACFQPPYFAVVLLISLMV
ncbi:1,4-dihydroxy-2-naphthoate octaprenyltransferase [Bifidobacterium leontopitheci]|uniref:1,4-dihydroxy-2-naphthoate octaprenyltransferase n=1 Tax=Bifidobacterium leontopitheci TaxID=2650774 RepID=A0A6I1GQX9_9BIFI|nr:1,4-dihydroxy-2-naphthoate octaprenyltransferase [Bifidobacterium leontopitheci]KAB7790538.1 1,4-dihydroxy-2-naphthoate octaprenyltransferase [Bifidobacterium leontopitheci]